MNETINSTSGPADSSAETMVRRYGRTQRIAHWWLAATFVLTVATAPESARGDTLLLVLHICSASALVLGLIAIAVFGTRAALVGDIKNLIRITPEDRAWLRSMATRKGEPAGVRPGKFNAGQKIAAWLLFLGIVAILMSGLLDTIVGRDVIHPVFIALTAIVIAGHVFLAVIFPATRPALHGMVFGTVSRAWARRHHPAWLDEVEASEADPARD